MRNKTFYAGWILTLLATLAAIYGGKAINDRIVIAVLFIYCAASTVCLLRNPTFPKRDAGLATSWMGPLLLAISMIGYFFYFNPTLQALSNQTSPSAVSVTSMNNILIVETFLGGCVNAYSHTGCVLDMDKFRCQL